MNVLGKRLGAGGLHRRQAIAQDGGQNLDHLTIAVVGTGELAPDAVQGRRQHPVLEWRAVAQRAGLARQDRHVMPGIVSGLAAAEGALVLGDDPPVLADDDAVGVGVDVDRAADRAGADRIAVVVEANEAGLRHRGRQRVESVEAAAVRDESRALFLERLPDRLPAVFGVGVRFGPDDAFVDEPGVQLVVAPEAQSRRDEALADKPDLVLGLTPKTASIAVFMLS